MISNKTRVITIYFVALLMYFSKKSVTFLNSFTEFCIVWNDLSFYLSSISTDLWRTVPPETLQSHFTNFCVPECSTNLPFPFSQKSVSYKMSCLIHVSLSLNSVSYEIIWHFLISPFSEFCVVYRVVTATTRISPLCYCITSVLQFSRTLCHMKLSFI